MKQMSLIEMNGFLKGKCIPRDLKVNETNAEYLVRKFAEAEAKISALSEDHQKAIESIKQADAAVKLAHEKFSAMAAENARLKYAVTQQIELRAEIKKAGRPPHADFWVQSICEAEEKVKRALEETPATDAFLAEVRAQGVEMFADHLLCPDLDDTIRDFAAQLRKGGNQ
ncbi:hNH endonuclease [Escherichia coli]|nr:hNH endonuclease [Escherichia coli]EFI4059397.1 hNH endonuclease [Escherichia coli]